MEQKAFQVAFPAAFVVVMVAFLSAIFFASPNPSFAASGKKKTSEVARTSAVDHAEARIKELRGALNITEVQEELWTDFTKVMRENAKEMDALTKERNEIKNSLNAVERMKLHSQVTGARLEQMEKLIPVFEALYDSMSAEQKKITDAIFQTGRHGKQKTK